MAVPAEQQARQALGQLSTHQKRDGDPLENKVDKRQAALAPAAKGVENAAPMLAPPSPVNVGGEGVVFQHAINGAAPLDLGDGGDGVNRLPGDLPIPDGAIAACIHSLRYAGVPTVCALTHGYKVAKLGSAAETDAAAAAARLGTAVAKGLGCAHDGRDLAANYVWQPDEVAAKADQMYN